MVLSTKLECPRVAHELLRSFACCSCASKPTAARVLSVLTCFPNSAVLHVYSKTELRNGLECPPLLLACRLVSCLRLEYFYQVFHLLFFNSLEGRVEAHLEVPKANAQGNRSEAEILADGTARSFFDVQGAALADSLAERIEIFQKSVDDRFNILC